MSPLAAIYHPGGSDPDGYPVALVDLITTLVGRRRAPSPRPSA